MMRNSPALHPSGQSSGTPTGSYSIDAFDFGSSDFAMPSSLDDLSIFANPTASLAGSEAGSSSHASHHPSPSNLSRPDALPSSHLQTIHTSSPLSLHRHRFDKSASPQSHTGSIADGRPRQNSSERSAKMSYSSFMHQGQSSSNQSHSHQNQSQPPSAGHASHPQQRQQQGGLEQQGSGLPQMSIADLQRMLMEKERTERIQNMQTALLKQQLEQLQRMQQAHQQQGSGGTGQPNIPAQLGHNVLNSLGADVPQNQQSNFLAALQNALNGGHQQNGSLTDQQSSHGHWQPTGAGHGTGVPISITNTSDNSSALAQYGLMTPMGSGAFSNSSCPPGQTSFMSPLNIPVGSQPVTSPAVEAPIGFLNQFTPLESPAVTPASVFSNASTGIVMHELFSPLTSPALGPQPPSLGEIMLPAAQIGHPSHQQMQQQQASGLSASPAFNAVSSHTPTASPLALMGKSSSSGSKIRKNRSTTAEARANKIRPSPLIKPTQGTGGRKKKDSISNMSPSTSVPSGGSNVSSRRPSISEAPPASGSRTHSRHHSTEAGHSEGTSSTPSPIDLGGGTMPPPSGPPSKPLTPGSIMGIRPLESKRSSLQGLAPAPGIRSQPLASAIKGKQRVENDQQPNQSPVPQQQPAQQQQKQQHQYAHIAPFLGSQSPGPKVTFNLQNGNGSSSGNNSSSSSSVIANGNAGPANNLPHLHPNGSLPIQPGGLTQADRDAWMSYKSAGGLESRRTSHKAAEQKRRDSLKFCFDELRGLLPAITLDEDAPSGSRLGPDGTVEDQNDESFDLAEVGDSETARSANKAISKVALLRHSNEYLIRLTKRLSRRDRALAVCRQEIAELRQQLGLPPSEDPILTGKGVERSMDALLAAPMSRNGSVDGADERDFDEAEAGSDSGSAKMEEDATVCAVPAGMDTS